MDVEVLVLRLLPDGDLGHRWVRGVVLPGTSPDECAVELVGCTDGLCHSTSWRRAGPGSVVLTYAALPDPEPELPVEPLGSPLVVSGGAALRPTPCQLEVTNLAAHAVRHLADLAERDPVVRGLVDQDRPLWTAVIAAAGWARHGLDPPPPSGRTPPRLRPYRRDLTSTTTKERTL